MFRHFCTSILTIDSSIISFIYITYPYPIIDWVRVKGPLAFFSPKSLIDLQRGRFQIQIDGDLFKAMIYMPK
jgi:hypothetical protein